MKILIFCPYYPPHIGGLETHADEFNKYLSQRGIDIIVFTPRLPRNAPERETRYGKVKIIRFPAFEIIRNYPLPKFWLKKYWGLKKEIKKESFDIVISRTRFFFTSLMAMFFAKSRKITWVHIEHGSDFVRLSSRSKTALAKLYDHIFGRLIFKYSDLNISISETVRKFVRKFDSRKSPVIRRGLDIEEISKIEPDKEIRRKYEGKTIVAFAGRLYKWKGIENSIQAVKSLPSETKNKIVFLIIGDGEDSERLKRLFGDDNSMLMLGGMPREKVIGILKSSDIFIHSSLPGGGLSTSLLEAMYCGPAVIATPNEGADEVVTNRKNGLLIIEPYVEKIAESLTELTENQSLRQNLSKNAAGFVAENFQWRKAIEAYEKIFRSLAKK